MKHNHKWMSHGECLYCRVSIVLYCIEGMCVYFEYMIWIIIRSILCCTELALIFALMFVFCTFTCVCVCVRMCVLTSEYAVVMCSYSPWWWWIVSSRSWSSDGSSPSPHALHHGSTLLMYWGENTHITHIAHIYVYLHICCVQWSGYFFETKMTKIIMKPLWLCVDNWLHL